MKSRKAPTKNELAQKVQGQTADLAQRLDNVETAARISQMLIQQIGNSTSQIANDIRELANRQRDIQYRLLAIQELSGLDSKKILEFSENKQIEDFTEASNKENEEKGFTPGDKVNEDSVVVIKTVTEDTEKSILRSKLVLSELNLPDFRESLLDKKTGDTFDADINGVTHSVTVLEVLQQPAKPEKTEETNEKD